MSTIPRFTAGLLAGVSLIALALFSGCGGKDTQSLNFGGSTTVLPIMESAIEEYEKLHPELTLSYEAQGSSVGIKGVMEGTIALGASSRNLRDSEKEAGVMATPIALDGVAVIVNDRVTIDNLSLAQAARIFSGEINNWSQVGGPDAKIIIINRDEASGTRETFLETCLKPGAGEKAVFYRGAIIVESNGDMVQKVGATPYAVGYCGFGYIQNARQAGGKELSVGGATPTVRNVLNKSYPLQRELYVVHQGPLKEETPEKKFVDYLLSRDGQKIVKDQKFIPLR